MAKTRSVQYGAHHILWLIGTFTWLTDMHGYQMYWSCMLQGLWSALKPSPWNWLPQVCSLCGDDSRLHGNPVQRSSAKSTSQIALGARRMRRLRWRSAGLRALKEAKRERHRSKSRKTGGSALLLD